MNIHPRTHEPDGDEPSELPVEPDQGPVPVGAPGGKPQEGNEDPEV